MTSPRWHNYIYVTKFTKQAEQALAEQALERDRKRLEKTQADKLYVSNLLSGPSYS